MASPTGMPQVKSPDWMHTASWILGFVGVAILLSAGYIFQRTGEAGPSGLLLVLAVLFWSQSVRLRKWIHQMESLKE